eukprot:SRR837773.15956.p2 GENE.SRR837773.15956~~SRR837773.15956.p2  ORF type:complete len:187 (-),score=31.19 SRR837773.15956:47-607(-)
MVRLMQQQRRAERYAAASTARRGEPPAAAEPALGTAATAAVDASAPAAGTGQTNLIKFFGTGLLKFFPGGAGRTLKPSGAAAAPMEPAKGSLKSYFGANRPPRQHAPLSAAPLLTLPATSPAQALPSQVEEEVDYSWLEDATREQDQCPAERGPPDVTFAAADVQPSGMPTEEELAAAAAAGLVWL